MWTDNKRAGRVVRNGTSHLRHMPCGDIDMWDDFLRKILSRFRANEMGILCQTDDTITMIGLKLFQGVATKINKIDKVRKSVMANMRKLARLYLQFRNVKGQDAALSDMLRRENFQQFQAAVRHVTTVDAESGNTTVKPGVRATLSLCNKQRLQICEGRIFAAPQG